MEISLRPTSPRLGRSRIRLIAGLLVVGIALVLAWALLRGGEGRASLDAAAPPRQPMEFAAVDVTHVAKGALQRTVRITGTLNALNQVALKSPYAGRIDSVAVRAGDHVKKGDVLARFETVDIAASLKQAEANLRSALAQQVLAKKKLDRVSALAAKGFQAKSDLDQAESDMHAADEAVTAQRQLVTTAKKVVFDGIVRSPIDGVVSARNVDPGQNVGPNGDLFSVVDLSDMEMVADIPAAAVGEIEVGQKASLSVQGFPDGSITAQVARINPTANVQSGSVTIYLKVDNPSEKLKGNLFATGEVVVAEEPSAIGLPLAAVHKSDEGDYVFRIADGKLERRLVKKGGLWSDGQTIEITQGVAPGDVIVTAPIDNLDSGAPAVVVD
jgi:RND family efflux transporter MFP subunit